MATTTKTLLAGSSTDGFTVVSSTGFNVVTAGLGSLYASKTHPAGPNTYLADFRQSEAANTYADWGVPAGARVTGIRVLSLTGSLSGVDVSALATLYTDEASLGSFNPDSIGPIDNSAASVEPISKRASDYVRVEAILSANVEFNEEGEYGTITVQINDFEIEVTWEPINEMFFGVL